MLGILFAILSLLGFGSIDYLISGSSRRIGAYRTTLWLLITRVIMLIVLVPLFLVYVSPQPLLILVMLVAAIAGVMGTLGLSKGLRAGSISVFPRWFQPILS